MALPPEPLDDVLPGATLVVVAEVVTVDDIGAWPKSDKGGPIDGAPNRPEQRAHLKVTRVLRGAPPKSGELVVTKPPANYALVPGSRGAFLIDAHAVILGRYGPDTYAPDEVEAALRALSHDGPNGGR